MQITDFFAVLTWWAVLFVIGIVFLSTVSRFFPAFFDRGYIFSKMLGSAILTYTLFLIGILHILPFSSLENWGILGLFALAFHIRFLPHPNRFVIKTTLPQLIKTHWPIFFLEEAIFLFCLFFWSWVRSYSPDVHGLEKYMDFGFINSILRSDYFPPKDMWFPPLSINYYYFGHMITGVLTKLSLLPSLLTFNLMIATMFALSFAAAFSIGANLIYLTYAKQHPVVNIRLVLSGLLSAALVTLAGNLHIIYAFFKPYQNEHPVPPWQLSYNPMGFPNAYWYPNATRFIYNTIHEFPIYSWVVSDLHGHVLDIPFVLTTLAVLLSLMTQDVVKKKNSQGTPHRFFSWSQVRNSGIKIESLLLISFLLAVMYMTNAWDGIIYFLLTMFVILYLQLKTVFTSEKNIGFKQYLKEILSSEALRTSGLLLILILGAYVLFTLPYSIFFKPFVSGIGILCAPDALTRIGKIGPFLFEPQHCQKSPWWQLLILYGFFAFFAASFLVFIQKVKRVSVAEWFVFLLIVLSVILIIIPEFIYAKDIYPAHYRANTMFKLVFQAFMMLSLVSGYTFVRLLRIFREQLAEKTSSLLSKLGLGIWCFIGLWLCALVLLYPYLATMSYYGNLLTYHGLDGTAYLKTNYPTDYAGINWINKNISGQPIMLEAQGDSYTDYERVSANTGLPTVLGWTVHEWLWRGTYDIPAPRIAEVQTLYTSTDTQIVSALIKKYAIRYVFIGDLERQKYPTMTETVFKRLGSLVYTKGNTRIYKITS